MLIKAKLDDLEKMLPGDVFILCHRGFIVNLTWTKQLRPYEFEMKSGLPVPIGRPRCVQVNKCFFRYIMD